MKFDKPIALAADHGGYELKEAITAHQDALGVAYTAKGTDTTASKRKGSRACCCSDTFSAEFTRRHNNAIALCLGGRGVGAGLGCQIVDAFLNAEFEGGRHQMRIDKMMALESH